MTFIRGSRPDRKIEQTDLNRHSFSGIFYEHIEQGTEEDDQRHNTNDAIAAPQHSQHSGAGRSRSVPVNTQGHRVAVYIEPPAIEELKYLDARTKSGQLCNAYHLQGACNKPGKCGLDHHRLNSRRVRALGYKMRAQPCARGSDCCVEYCYAGHMCQKSACKNGRKNNRCDSKSELHNVDVRVDDWYQRSTPQPRTPPSLEQPAQMTLYQTTKPSRSTISIQRLHNLGLLPSTLGMRDWMCP